MRHTAISLALAGAAFAAGAARADCADQLRDAEARMAASGPLATGPASDARRRLDAMRRLDAARAEATAGTDEIYCRSLVRSAEQGKGATGAPAPSSHPPLGSGAGRGPLQR
jgi:hypothetical protein